MVPTPTPIHMVINHAIHFGNFCIIGFELNNLAWDGKQLRIVAPYHISAIRWFLLHIPHLLIFRSLYIALSIIHTLGLVIHSTPTGAHMVTPTVYRKIY